MKIYIDNQIGYLQEFGGISQVFKDLEINLSQFVKVTKRKPVALRNKYLSILVYFVLNYIDTLRLKRGTAVIYSYYLPTISLIRKDLIKISFLHDLTFEELEFKNIKVKLLLKLKKFVLSRSDKIICISNATRNLASKHYPFLDTKFLVVHNSLPTHFNKEFPKSLSKKYLLYVGNRKGYKNFTGLLSLMPKLKKEYLLHCYGGGKFSARETLLLKNLGLENSVIWHDPNTSSLGSLYKSAKCLIIPSKREGFGLTVLEAYSQGCPVVTFGDSALREVGGDLILDLSKTDSEMVCLAIRKHLKNVDTDKLKTRAKQFSGVWQTLGVLSAIKYCNKISMASPNTYKTF